MKLSKSKIFQYIKIESEGKRYFCLQQNPIVLAWILFFKKDTMCPIFRPDSKKMQQKLVSSLRYKFKFIRTNLIILIIFACYKYQLRRINSVVNLPIYGQICVPVHKGYKIFDLRRGVVSKIFDLDVNISSISSEIKALEKISQIDFAPSLKRWNIEERWYEEDYVNGSSLDSPRKPQDLEDLLKKFYHDLIPHINSLVLFQQPITRNSIEYINEIIEILEVSRLSRQGSTAREFSKIQGFIDSVFERLRVEGNCPVHLGYWI